MNTPGKGPFANRAGEDLSVRPHWTVPLTPLDDPAIAALMKFVQNRCDAGSVRLFEHLLSMSATHRLSRNLIETIRRLAVDSDIFDVLVGGLSSAEDTALSQMEASRVPVDILGTAHSLLHIRERQGLIVAMGQAFQTIKGGR